MRLLSPGRVLQGVLGVQSVDARTFRQSFEEPGDSPAFVQDRPSRNLGGVRREDRHGPDVSQHGRDLLKAYAADMHAEQRSAVPEETGRNR